MSISDIWMFLQQGVLSGLVTGSVYALLAIAIVIVFKTTDVPNFSQGEIFMFGGYVALFLLAVWNWAYWPAAVTAVVVTAFVAGLFQRVVMQKVVDSKGVGVQMVIATLGFAYLLKGIVRKTGLGDTPRSLPSVVPQDTVLIGQAALTTLDLAIFATALVAMALLWWMFTKTRTGKAMRAVGMNPRGAQIVGVNLSKIRMQIWCLTGVLSAISALLITPKILITPDIGHIAIVAYAAAIVGGFTSLPGAVLGGFIIGILENLVGLFISSNAIVVTPFLAIMVVLLFRPQGLLGGKPQTKKV
ncbi:branched-chain amino acid ABC transporter permease [Paenacidovorax monticola]|uniref:Branched-chain amino acid ABC transporter permease n=1 Tax=Paenacidovorax monticola TaxID=1926868 RepID=A0A7H0HJP5_9BURK|nr:branched-chain amino acid ABC transporter permease [Paenacidovorax monticola]QNP60761.1 branched-chain amino acid ABC transporter permease [Paenacidovorax monticola]